MITTNTTAYLLFISAGIVLCYVLFAFLLQKQLRVSATRALALCATALGMGILLGIIGAKLLYGLFRISYLLKTGFGSLFSLRPDEMSYYGGAAGVCFGVFLAAKLLGEKPLKALNAFAFPGAFLAALFRFAERWLGALGTGDYIETPLPFPLAVFEAWNPDFPEYYLAIFMLEGVLSLRVALFAWQNRRDVLCFLRTVFYLCLFQIACESMRAQSLRWLFVRYEQLLCFLVVEAILIWYAVISKKQGIRNWGASVFGLFVCAVGVLCEFMLDGKIVIGEYGLPPVFIYGVMSWALLELAVQEHIARRKLSKVKSFHD